MGSNADLAADCIKICAPNLGRAALSTLQALSQTCRCCQLCPCYLVWRSDVQAKALQGSASGG